MSRDTLAERTPVEARPAAPAAVKAPGVERARGGALAVGVAVFMGGAVLLGVEIAASRVLAPFFGNSLFVWGALIGVVLAGLAAGYWGGGALADRLPAPGLLVSVLAAAAILIFAIPLVDERVLEAVVAWNPGPRLNPLVAAIALFGAPSVVLAAVTPIAVRLRARSVASVGRTAGRLFALSTGGSIVGTFATSFWLIPELGTNELLGIAAAALMGTVALVALSERMAIPFLLALAAAGAATAAALSLSPQEGRTLEGAAARNWSPVYALTDKGRAGEPDYSGVRVRYTSDTRYHRLAVVEDADTRYLRFDNSYQSAMYLEHPFRTRFRYTDFFHLGVVYNPQARNAFFVGLGGGSAPKRFWRDFPRLRIQVAELDPEVVEAAYRFFAIPRSPRLRIAVEDGRRYLARDARRWDIVALDAFYADSIPFHLTTREFLQLVRRRLAPGGVLVTNVIGAIEGPGSKLFRSLYRTYRAVFPTVVVHPVNFPGDERPSDSRNIILVASTGAAPRRSFLLERWNVVRRSAPSAPTLTRAIRDRYESFIPTGDVPTLTDDYAPTDALLLVDQ